MECGVTFASAGTRGRLEGCDVSRNKGINIIIEEGAEPCLASCECVPAVVCPMCKMGVAYSPTSRLMYPSVV